MNTATVTAPTSAFQCPHGMNLGQWMRRRLATRGTRRADWDALPARAEGPLQLHIDGQVVFLVLRGRVKLMAERNGETWEAEASDCDRISWLVGVYCGVVLDLPAEPSALSQVKR